MKKYRKYILLVAFIALFSFNNVQAYTPKCDLDASKKMDWAISQFENEIIPWGNLSGLQKSSVSGIASNGNPDTSKSLFTHYYKLAPQLYYDDSYGCGYEAPRQGEEPEQGQSVSDKTLVLEILHKGSVIKTISTVPKSEVIYQTSNNTYIPTKQKIFLKDICEAWDTSNASNVENCSIQFRAKDKNEVPKVSDLLNFQYTETTNTSGTPEISDSDYIEIQPKYFFKEPPAEVSDSCNLTADDIWFGSGNVDLKNPVLTGKNISLHIDTAGRCDGQKITVLLREADLILTTDNDIDISNLKKDKTKIRIETIPYKNTIINFIGGEDDCEQHSDWGQISSTIDWFHGIGITDNAIINNLDDLDCQIYVSIYNGHYNAPSLPGAIVLNGALSWLGDAVTKIASTRSKIPTHWGNSLKGYYPVNFKNGIIGGECDNNSSDSIIDLCSGSDWKLKNIVGAKIPDNENLEVLNSQQNYDSKSPCFENGKYLENCYEFLAPLDGIEKNAKGNLQENFKVSGNRIAILDIRKYELGNYVNKIFQMAISILGILAVVMIIIAGIQYMTVESIYGKSDAKERIIGAVTGLMLSIGIFVILNTINPQLLQINFGSNLDVASVDGKPTQNSDGSYNTTTSNGKVRPFKVNNILQTDGMPWKPENTDEWKTLRSTTNPLNTTIPNVYINKGECSNINKSCTSTYFDGPVHDRIKVGLKKLQEACDCKITISGGSEFWSHKTHGPYSTKIDISHTNSSADDKKKLAETLTKGAHSSLESAIASGNYRNVNSDINYLSKIYAEDGSQKHWHLTFK